jgi:hypothetical protein
LRDPQEVALLLEDLILVTTWMALARPPNTTKHELKAAVDYSAEGPVWVESGPPKPTSAAPSSSKDDETSVRRVCHVLRLWLCSGCSEECGPRWLVLFPGPLCGGESGDGRPRGGSRKGCRLLFACPPPFGPASLFIRAPARMWTSKRELPRPSHQDENSCSEIELIERKHRAQGALLHACGEYPFLLDGGVGVGLSFSSRSRSVSMAPRRLPVLLTTVRSGSKVNASRTVVSIATFTAHRSKRWTTDVKSARS